MSTKGDKTLENPEDTEDTEYWDNVIKYVKNLPELRKHREEMKKKMREEEEKKEEEAMLDNQFSNMTSNMTTMGLKEDTPLGKRERNGGKYNKSKKTRKYKKSRKF